eukprot:CAMPEP_0194495016 /NCGR_PEP_ID=MMETSP0253-20130528/12746_1 /TAXON_ID=2966 /ORGANISM="Noctiluca scintillans" /LENGTH=247 /DNA_ID=CAMNT_0039336209 /DNA_START=153 /DNA_END=896 /DNA_ORIENTATION=-
MAAAFDEGCQEHGACPQSHVKEMGHKPCAIDEIFLDPCHEQEPVSATEVSEAVCAPASVGSLEHGTGRCKPCAFFHTRGCQLGSGCLFCHVCPPGEKRRRKQVQRLKCPSSADNRRQEEKVSCDPSSKVPETQETHGTGVSRETRCEPNATTVEISTTSKEVSDVFSGTVPKLTCQSRNVSAAGDSWCDWNDWRCSSATPMQPAYLDIQQLKTDFVSRNEVRIASPVSVDPVVRNLMGLSVVARLSL